MSVIDKLRNLFLIFLSLFTFSVLIAEEEEIYLKSISDQIQVITQDLKTLERLFIKNQIYQIYQTLVIPHH